MCFFQRKTIAISWKRWEIWPRLLLCITNRKWHTPYVRSWDGNHWLWVTVKTASHYCG